MCADFHRTLHVAPRNTHSLRIKVRVRVCRITSNLEGQVMKVVEGKELETAITSYTHTHKQTKQTHKQTHNTKCKYTKYR